MAFSFDGVILFSDYAQTISTKEAAMSQGPVIKAFEIGLHWEAIGPFLFIAHHYEAYPKANEDMSPAASLEGRNIGQDFDTRNAWRMYHGDKVPGFPAHPHRGFETVSIVRKGYVDHADSFGAAARYGDRSEEHTSELQSRGHLVCRLLLEKKKQRTTPGHHRSAHRPSSTRT